MIVILLKSMTMINEAQNNYKALSPFSEQLSYQAALMPWPLNLLIWIDSR